MTTKAEIQDLLRFLSQDAKIPLQVTVGKIKMMQDANLTSPTAIASSSITKLEPIFRDPKHPKQILAAAKRVTKKRPTDPSLPSPSKRQKTSTCPQQPDSEEALALPTCNTSASELSSIQLQTNRAPLLLAFAVTSLKYTMPKQPLSSRLSLGHAVVSANSKTKAVSIGLREPGKGEDELMVGLRRAKVLSREVGVLRRMGAVEGGGGEEGVKGEDGNGEAVKKENEEVGRVMQESGEVKQEPHEPPEPALWGVDLDALQNSKTAHTSTGGLPIHTPQSARHYLLKSFLTPPSPDLPSKSKTPKLIAQEKEQNLASLLRALEMLFGSWIETDEEDKFYGLGREELERRAWGWYVRVRPDVKAGVGGWGEKGVVKLGDILGLRRKPDIKMEGNSHEKSSGDTES
ncbi:MAG: hypothetical protein MMC23_004509 [Stictis urceolatum]|nr:hypothetical protein [Stictis urceolata]